MNQVESASNFEALIRHRTAPLNGQLPRPWMTDLSDPLKARVFIVGRNQRNTYLASRVSHERHLNALFNRSGESCRKLYDEVTGHRSSRTRHNTDELSKLLRTVGVDQILETNVICYSSPMSHDLCKADHADGKRIGTEIFSELLKVIKPRVLIAHGAGTLKDLGKVLDKPLLEAQPELESPVFTDVGEVRVFAIPSLAPPAWNKWSKRAGPHLKIVAEAVAETLQRNVRKP